MNNERFGRYRLLLLFLIIYFIFRSPSFLAPKVTDWIPLMASIADAYLISFIIFLIIKNYEGIVSSLKRLIGIIYNRNDNVRSDLGKFIIIAFLLTFLVNFSVPFFSVFLDLVLPGFGTIRATFFQMLASYQNFNPQQFITSISSLINIGSATTYLFFLPPVGAIILFLLRQIRYRSIKNNKNEQYTGSTIFIIFLMIMMLNLIFILYVNLDQIVHPPNLSNRQSKSDNSIAIYLTNQSKRDNPIAIYLTNQSKSDNPIVINLTDQVASPYGGISLLDYGLKSFMDFLTKYLLNPSFYVITISIWLFDWFLYSRSWFVNRSAADSK